MSWTYENELKWEEIFETSGSHQSVVRDGAYNKYMRGQLVYLFQAVVGASTPDAYIERGQETADGVGLLTALAAFGSHLVRVDLPYAVVQEKIGLAFRLGSIRVRESARTLLAVDALPIGGHLENIQERLAERGLILRLLVPEGLADDGEAGWMEFDLEYVTPASNRRNTYQDWRQILGVGGLRAALST